MYESSDAIDLKDQISESMNVQIQQDVILKTESRIMQNWVQQEQEK